MPAPDTPTIICDTREQTPLAIPDGFEAAVTVARATLATGDYSLAGLEWCVAVERKSPADAWGSVLRGRRRFRDCFERLAALRVAPRDRAGFAVVVIECSEAALWTPPSRHHAERNARSVVGTYRSWSQGLGVPVVFCDGREAAGRSIAEMLLAQWDRLRDLASPEAEAEARAASAGIQ